ncbi:helix-turn-helix transcriptional regulator [Pinirhizobacter sp.]|jgi:DNA-binding XRE family transcriptional regulator|uniref:helix-turn-helix transcriptional regulator n=1 Tax=Pinirhizobacter sp. TaxID=2950432 RepID=UPI002F40A67B
MLSAGIETSIAALLAGLGQCPRDQRIRLGHSQEDLPKLANISTRSIHHVEAGGSSTTATVVKILKAMGIADDLKAIAPFPSASPMAALRKSKGAQRVGVPGKKKREA